MSQFVASSEEVVLGILLTDPSIYPKIELNVTDFSSEANRAIYRTIQTLAKHGRAIDVITVAESSGNPELSVECFKLANETYSSAGAAEYAQNIRQAARIREAKRIARALPDALDNHGSKAIERAVAALIKLGDDGRDWNFTLSDALNDALAIIDERETSGGKVKLPSGLHDLDAQLGGWHPSDLTVIGARPAMGKTALLLNLAYNCNAPCGLLTLEQPREQVGLRFLSLDAEVPLESMRTGRLIDSDYQRVSSSLITLSKHEIYGYDKPGATISDVIRQARKWRYEHGIQVLFVDYLQLIEPDDRRLQRNHQVSATAKGLKFIAKDLGIPVVTLAQLNRDLEKRTDKRPMMSDLRDAGEIEQEADQIIMLYRDEVYDEATADPGVMELITCKNRHGQTGVVKASWIAEYLQIKNLPPAWANYEGMAHA